MQRLNDKDVSAEAIALGYDHLCLPMRFEHGLSKWVIGAGDPRTVDNELMFPERFSETSVQELEKSLGKYAIAGQLQQRPSPLGGGLIKGIWFPRYSVLPIIKYRKIYADTAQKVKEHNDYSVFQCWGYADDGRIYLIDQVRGKWEAPELERTAVDFWNKHKTAGLREMMIEDKASGTGLIQTIKRKGGIPVRGIERSTDKLTRVMDGVGYVESGYVYLPDNQAWVSEFIAECEAFTPDDSHPHDDQIDPMMDARKDMLGSNRGMVIDTSILSKI
jgi:predicted phage terminase large subunit-like protein